MTDDADDNAFYCMACNKSFHSPLYSITRSNEQIHFYSGERLPEAEVLFAESIGDYCSKACQDLNRDHLLKSHQVRSTYPGPGPVESCSRCGNPVDMSRPHWTWTEEMADVVWGQGIEQIQPTEAHLLAVLCRKCDLNSDQSLESNKRIEERVLDT